MPVSLKKVPALQLVHVAAPSRLNVPEPQMIQSASASCAGALVAASASAFPATQFLHPDEASASAYDPLEQILQAAWPVGVAN